MKITGTGVSGGIGIGRIVLIEEPELDVSKRTVTNPIAEQEELQAATDRLLAVLQEKVDQLSGEQAEILATQLALLADPALLPEINRLIEAESVNKEYALNQVFEQFIQMFQMSGNELMMLRSTDLKDIRQNLLCVLKGIELVDISQVPDGTILAARELTTSVAAGINPDRIAGIITEIGGKTSHMSIIARSIGVPAIVGIDVNMLQKDMPVILDGESGTLIALPTVEEQAKYTEKLEAIQKQRQALERYRGVASQTADGVEIELCANVGLPVDIDQAVADDAEGIGLFRTEFLYMDRSNAPGEQEQMDAYRKVAEAFAGKTVIIRTLDVGGDKEIPYLGIAKEENPFLGFRAIRYCLHNEALFRIQIRAILQAFAGSSVKIMLPMISEVSEFLAGKNLIETVIEELKAEGRECCQTVHIGMMIETPSAAVMADIFARHADFFSIGTNDLTQYVIAVDRGNKDVEHLYNTFHPAVLRLINQIGKAAKAAGIPCGICGEAAADPLLTRFLIGSGIDELSMTANRILGVREAVLKTDVQAARSKIDAGLWELETLTDAEVFLKQL